MLKKTTDQLSIQFRFRYAHLWLIWTGNLKIEFEFSCILAWWKKKKWQAPFSWRTRGNRISCTEKYSSKRNRRRNRHRGKRALIRNIGAHEERKKIQRGVCQSPRVREAKIHPCSSEHYRPSSEATGDGGSVPARRPVSWTYRTAYTEVSQRPAPRFRSDYPSIHRESVRKKDRGSSQETGAEKKAKTKDALGNQKQKNHRQKT